jgi:ribosomal protein S18 acetylase RimI-like enzyme
MVTLQPITEAELQRVLEPTILEYAPDHVKHGQWTEAESIEKSRKEFQDLLPQGVATSNHYLFTLVNEDQQQVGMLWFARRESQGQFMAFVYEVRIDEAFRRRGYASQAFREMETRVRELGWNRISLHVFGTNHAAIDLYNKLGYEMTNVMMAKNLDPQ